MGVLEILGLVLGSGGISSLATWFFHIKAERRLKMAEAEQIMRRRKLDQLMADGVSIIDPNNTYVDTTVTIGRDTVLYPGHMSPSTIKREKQYNPFVN